MAGIELRVPSLDGLSQYADALRRGWSPDNVGGRKTAEEQLARIAEDPNAFLDTQDDPEGKGPPLILPSGAEVKRLPGYYRWIWDDGFCGTLGFRWQPGTSDLPPHVLGHIGYAVPEWKRGKGYATRGLALILPDARARGLTHVDLTTDEDNIASQKVITVNGGVLVERFPTPSVYGGEGEKLRFRITL